MSDLQFPKNPVVGQEYDFTPYKYYWDGAKWKTMGIGYNPVNDLRNEVEPRIGILENNIEDLSTQSFEALRRSYAEAGLNLVDGSFEEGGTLTSATDVLLYKVSGNAYAYSGGFPHTVTASTDPTSVTEYVTRAGVYGKTNDWTPSITGGTTAGTYELDTAIGKISRSGNIVALSGLIKLAATVTGGGSGLLLIRGISIPKPNDGLRPVGSVLLNGIPFTGDPVLLFVSSGVSSELMIALNKTNAAPDAMQITDIGPGDYFHFSITYTV